MKKYLKMSDVFDGRMPVSSFKVSRNETAVIDCNGFNIASPYDKSDSNSIVHAINSHDELVASLEAARAERDEWERRACKEASTVKALLDDMVKISKRGGEWHDEWDAVGAITDVSDIADKWSEE